MTLSDVKNDLFVFFGKKDMFSIEENFDDLYILSEDKELDTALIEKALEEYVNQKMVSLVTTAKNKKIWVLEKSLDKYTQTVELTYPTLVTLTKVINNYCDQLKNDQSRVDALNVQEKDVQSLIVLAGQAIGMNIQ